MSSRYLIVLVCLASFVEGCKVDANKEMVDILASKYKTYSIKDNRFCPEAEFAYYDSLLYRTVNPQERLMLTYQRSGALLKIGREAEAVAGYESVVQQVGFEDPSNIPLIQELGLSYLRLGERQNCINNHTAESCIMPLQGSGIHKKLDGSQKAIQIFSFLLDRNPDDYESRWLMNLAYMTLGMYPDSVPKSYLIPNLDKNDALYSVQPFVDVAPNLALNKRNMAGGIITEDFNGDHYLDIVTTDWGLAGPMHYYQNDQKGSFVDLSAQSGLSKFRGGLNMIQADYDNDGDLDIYVLRGAWMSLYGHQPNSLLQNDGHGVFQEVTKASGLYCEHPTQAAVWRDFNNDGFVDLFVGNESVSAINDINPCQLFINDGKGKFLDRAEEANCKIIDFVKAVHSCDYDNDGLEDIITSGMTGQRKLLRNVGITNGLPKFVDVTVKAGLADIANKNSFGTWFWDVDNDGWNDIFVCGYDFINQSIGASTARDALGIPNEKGSTLLLYHNNHDGTFSNITKSARLDKAVFGMGANFGDIDNDGFLDMYIGTGNPDIKSLVPNRLFRNMGNGSFADVTVSARVGNLQKGHAVSMNDLDNDGDVDIFIMVGGAFIGDQYNNALYLNPGEPKNNWLKLRLEGKTGNHAAIGTKIKVTFRENGISRSVYSEVNSGGCFGASSLRKEIGVGTATMIDEIEITWTKSKTKQVFKNIKPNQCIKIEEGSPKTTSISLNVLDFFQKQIDADV